MNFQRFMKKPVRKDVDGMDTCHFRTLYKRQWFQDSYTDPDFLSALQLNTNLSYYNLNEAIGATSRISLHLSVCILYFIMYYHLGQDNVSPSRVFEISLYCTVLGYVVVQMWRFWSERWKLVTLLKIPLFADSLVVVCCGAFSYLFVPILRTVTTTMDIDTVHAMCAVLFGVHLITNYYGLVTHCVSQPLSINSALFSMICLSSRLQSDVYCLALLSYGVVSFICFPQFSRILWDWTPGTGIVVVICAWAGYTISPWLSLCIISVMFLVVVVSPGLYIYYVQYKQNILGPWDEAKPDLNFDIQEINKGFEARRKQPPPPSIPQDMQREQDDVARMEAMGIGMLL